MGLRPLEYWDRGLESRSGGMEFCLVGVLCYQVQVSASGRSLVQGSSTECGVSEYDLETSTVRRSRSELGCWVSNSKKCSIKGQQDFPKCQYTYIMIQVGVSFCKTIITVRTSHVKIQINF